MTNTNLIKNVISFFNEKTGRSMRFSNEKNVKVVQSCFNDEESNYNDIISYIGSYVDDHNGEEFGIIECLEGFQKPIKSTKDDSARLLESFLDSAKNTFMESKVKEIEDNLFTVCELKLDDYIKETYGYLPHKTSLIINDDVKKTINGVVHEKFDEVLGYVACNEPVYLVGPAGTGKNHLCEQIAEALDLTFYASNALTQEYHLTGFTDAHGVYQESQFYKAFTQGGLFFLDELDASIPEVVTKLNGALANRYFDFPSPIGLKRANANFRVVAAGNTYGLGADFEYTGRTQQDAASLDRFGTIEIDYDERIELEMASGDAELVSFAHELRRIAKEKGILFIISYRGIQRTRKLVNIITNLPSLLKSAIFKGLGHDDLVTFKNNMNIDNKYVEALKELVG